MLKFQFKQLCGLPTEIILSMIPLEFSSINGHGNLILYSKNQTIPVWFTNVSASSTSTSVAQLLNSGNFILSQPDSATVLWKSIDHPTNTMLPFTELGLDRKTGLNRFLTSWKSLDDPGTGEWSYYLEPSGLPEIVLYKGQVPWWRSGPWDGLSSIYEDLERFPCQEGGISSFGNALSFSVHWLHFHYILPEEEERKR
ncbi:hypothetical protein DKX38_005454 [Salix brachista]|uniref:Bulb-type lectin domain-containing protein n=1 Tax=Salix brachista TaxID=2182728 RepID=A0A5N5MZX0_9ROSI|nr:hypothetical protein DKX38_005454 [Salix brachista]